MKKLITCLSFVLAAVSVGYAAVTPLWMRDARISPDGSEIVCRWRCCPETDLSFCFGNSLHLYTGWEVCAFFRFHSRSGNQCIVSYKCYDGTV